MNPLFKELCEMAFRPGRAGANDRKAIAKIKIHQIMREWKDGNLKIGRSNKKVPKKNFKQAIAIALNSSQRYIDKLASHKRVYTGASMSVKPTAGSMKREAQRKAIFAKLKSKGKLK